MTSENASRRNRVYVDMDGVIADLITGFEKHTGTRYALGMTTEEFWHPVRTNAPDLFSKLPLCQHALESWHLLEKLLHADMYADAGYEKNLIILTNVPRESGITDQVVQDKYAWAATHFPGVPVICCHGKKSAYAVEGDVLIDDWYARHEKPWKAAGGLFVRHTSFRETVAEVVRILNMSVDIAKLRKAGSCE